MITQRKRIKTRIMVKTQDDEDMEAIDEMNDSSE